MKILVLFTILIAASMFNLYRNRYISPETRLENYYIARKKAAKNDKESMKVQQEAIVELSAAALDGKVLFKDNCASCHNRNMRDDLTGPALGGVKNRWAAFPEKDLYNWIKNAPQLIAAGHPRAVELFEAWDKTVMPAFSHLSEDDIAAVLSYVEETER